MVNRPVAARGYDFQAVRDGFESFLRHIIDQPLLQAKRRTINTARVPVLEEGEALVGRYMARNNFFKKLLAFLYRPFKRAGLAERLKQKIIAKQIYRK